MLAAAGAFSAGLLTGVVLMTLSADWARAWGVLWDPVGVPLWVLVAALILTMKFLRRGSGGGDDAP